MLCGLMRMAGATGGQRLMSKNAVAVCRAGGHWDERVAPSIPDSLTGDPGQWLSRVQNILKFF